jgi:hypothetical protein
VGIWEGISEVFAPAAEWINTNVIQPALAFFGEMWTKIKEIFQPAADWFKGVFDKVYNFLKPVINNIKIIVTGLWDIIKAVFSVVANWFNDKVIQPVVNKVAPLWNKLKTAASDAWEGIKSVFSKVSDFFKETFSKAWTKVKEVFSTGGKIFDGIKDGIVNAFKTIVNAIIKGINKVVAVPFNAINKVIGKIRGVSIAGISPFGGLSDISVPEIPLLAKGGIVDSATLAVIGERGKEAVLPLENNTEWMGMLANMLYQRLGGNTPIILNVDGNTFATTAISTINRHTEQTGQLALNIV